MTICACAQINLRPEFLNNDGGQKKGPGMARFLTTIEAGQVWESEEFVLRVDRVSSHELWYTWIETGRPGYGKDGEPLIKGCMPIESLLLLPSLRLRAPTQIPPEQTIPDEAWQAKQLTGNPKDAIGSAKAPCCTVPATVTAELGLAMFEGALKYGRHNYRAAPVRASVYVDAARRHIDAWFDAGQNDDPDSGLSHLAKAMACYGIIRDAQINDTLIDDRPPPSPVEHFAACNAHAKRLAEKYPNPIAPYVANDPRMQKP